MQYSFIYQALLEYYLYGDTELDVSSLEGHLHKLHNTFANGDRVGLEEEFKVRPLQVFNTTADRKPSKARDLCIFKFVTLCLLDFCPETDQYANNEGEHENGESSSQHEEEQSSANYSM